MPDLNKKTEKIEQIACRLKNAVIDFDRDVPLASITWMQTGGYAGLVAYPDNVKKFKLVLDVCIDLHLPTRVIGATSNILFLDDCVCTVLVSTIRLTCLEVGQTEFIAEAGVMLGNLSRLALRNSITGYEGFEGIPGTVGGAIFMNAGAYGSEISKVLVEVLVYKVSVGEIHTIRCEDMGFGFRRSKLMEDRDLVVLSAVFKMQQGSKSVIYSKMELYHAKRHRYNDYCYPNLGSLFVDDIVRMIVRKKMRTRIVVIMYSRFIRLLRFFTRQSPINEKFVIGILSKEHDLEKYADTYSLKGLNCLTNSGQGTTKMCAYIDHVKRLCGQPIRLENEIVAGDPVAP